MEKSFSIGRGSANHLTIDDDSMDDLHAKILKRGDTFLLKDMGSISGTLVNGKRVTQKNVGCGDLIQLGTATLEVVDPLDKHSNQAQWSLIADSSWLSGQEFPLEFDKHENRIIVGRSTECDVTIPGTHLSRQHAEIRYDNGALTLTDMKSANGSYVNDKKANSTRLSPGDKIRFDVYSFRLFGPGISLPKAATQTMPAISEALSETSQSEDKLWKTRPTSIGNRTQEDLYKKNWLPAILSASLLAAFTGLMIFLFYPR
ncbi:MAG: pSer/pThr/pTyr-binding forkhead associated (FHA) protein [Flavobacteriales bacterium]|jgi:pSer/pThr/pTyr-binding forkhead associated (FHA) protein